MKKYKNIYDILVRDDLLSHKSAPDLTNGSFWLGPHSPANIKLSTSKKYIYPSSNKFVVDLKSVFCWVM